MSRMAKALLQPMQTVTSIAEQRQSRASRNASSRFPQTPGQVYFIRHGESTSNERNIFAGVLDVELTAFGRMQARQAGLDLKRKGVQFDAVYVSHLKRARQTCDIALAVDVLNGRSGFRRSYTVAMKMGVVLGAIARFR